MHTIISIMLGNLDTHACCAMGKFLPVLTCCEVRLLFGKAGSRRGFDLEEIKEIVELTSSSTWSMSIELEPNEIWAMN